MGTPQCVERSSADEGYRKVLCNRQVQMIAMGGAIGVGLFLGAGRRLHEAGPGLVFTYAIAGLAAFFVMRALGELVMHRPTGGSFVSYAREFIGPWAGFVSGWMYWLNWAMTGIAEITAIAIYVNRWAPNLPQWITALIALVLLLGVNLLSVKIFGELEFWFSVIKVTAIVVFIAVGAALVMTNAHIGNATASVQNLTGHGGFLPVGLPVVLLGLQGVIFAYAGIEMVGIAAGETRNPLRVLPKAINGVIWRIAIFYAGSVLLLAMVLPWSVYSPNESPFVTVFSRLGVPWAGDLMNVVVLTAAASACNSGLYSTGRILRSLAQRGEAPRFANKLSSRHVPYGGVLLTASVLALGVGLNAWVPKQAFDIAVEVASLGVITTWATLLLCQIRLRAAALRGQVRRPQYRMPGAPWTNYCTLGFLAVVVIMMAFESDLATRIAFWCIPLLALVLWLAWRVVGRRTPLDPVMSAPQREAEVVRS
jgi:L-asparagine permease